MTVHVPDHYDPYLTRGDFAKRNGINARDYGYTSTGAGGTVEDAPGLIEACNYHFSRKGARFSGVTFVPDPWSTSSTGFTTASDTIARSLRAFTLGSRAFRESGSYTGSRVHAFRLQVFGSGYVLEAAIQRVNGSTRTTIWTGLVGQTSPDPEWRTLDVVFPVTDTQSGVGQEEYLTWSFGAEGVSRGANFDGGGGAGFAKIYQIQAASAILGGSDLFDQIFAP